MAMWSCLQPVLPQSSKKLLGEHHVAVPTTFSLSHMDEQSLRINVTYVEIQHLAQPQSGSVYHHRHGAVFGALEAVKQLADFTTTQHDGELGLFAPFLRNPLDFETPAERHGVEEFQ